MVTEWHTNLQAMGHAQSILAVEQHVHETGQVEIGDLPHPPFTGVRPGHMRHLCQCLVVSVTLVG